MKRLLNWFKTLKQLRSLKIGYQGVREITTQLYNKYPKGTDFGPLKVLNVGCGGCTYQGITNLDYSPGENIQVAHDLSKTPLPFEDNKFDLILANHVLEHIPNWFDCFSELARVLKPGGVVKVWIPTMGTDASFVYRDHINYMGLGSFCGVKNLPRAETNIEGNKHSDASKLILVNREMQFIKEWWVIFAPRPLKMWMASHLRNIVSEEGFTFRKVAL